MQITYQDLVESKAYVDLLNSSEISGANLGRLAKDFFEARSLQEYGGDFWKVLPLNLRTCLDWRETPQRFEFWQKVRHARNPYA